MSASGAGLTAILLLLVACSVASAQVRMRRDAPRPGSWELSGGLVGAGGFSGSDQKAELTRNGQPAGGFDLFSSSNRLSGGPGFQGTLAVYVSPAIAVEAGFLYLKPRLTVRLTGDIEDAQGLTARETMSRYVFRGTAVWHLRRPTAGRRAIPFVGAGGGYLRELHQGNELVETGTELHMLGGLKYWFGSARPRVGLRAEAGLSVRDGGFDFADKRRMLPMAAAGLVYLF